MRRNGSGGAAGESLHPAEASASPADSTSSASPACSVPEPTVPGATSAYAELHCLSNFSFLRGASHPHELVERAAELGYSAIAITDRNSLAGVVRAHTAAKALAADAASAKQTGQAEAEDVANIGSAHAAQVHPRVPPRLVVGAEIVPVDAPPIVLLAIDRRGYGNLCRLISRGRRRCRKGECEIRQGDVAQLCDGLIGIVVPEWTPPATAAKAPADRGGGASIDSSQRRAVAPRVVCAAAVDPAPRTLSVIPPEDPAVYDMICEADTVGVFQIESRAQMSMLPRLRPRNFYDLVIEVAIVRPGPIQGGMVHPFLRRRDGLEPVEYPNPAVRDVLHKTLGVPLFQEQAMRLAVVAAGFTPGEADQLRRAMAAWRRGGSIERFQVKLIRGMLERGYSKEFAEQIYKQIQGFGEYGFPESHAASFALLVYASAWLKRHHPAAFCAAMLNSQPLGFYTPGQLIRDAIAHGVCVRPVDVNFSDWDCTLEHADDADGTASRTQGGVASWGQGGPAVRLGLRLIRGLSAARARPLLEARAARCAEESLPESERRLTSLHQLAGVPRETLLRLAAGDAFRSCGLARRAAVWDILGMDRDAASLATDCGEEPASAGREPALFACATAVNRSARRDESRAPRADSPAEASAAPPADRSAVPAAVRKLLTSELALIRELRYEHYFLTVWDLVRFARSRGILCQGRGSAANSAVCYCLGVTAVDPTRHELLFERFISKERNEPPDIDVDFEHERREEVFQYIYEKYGRERAGVTAEVITYRPRSAVRDVAKVFGLSLDRIDALAKSIEWFDREAVPEDGIRAAGLDPQDRTVRMIVRLVRQILGFPRHLSQHVGGFVITESPLCEIVPIQNGGMPGRTFIEWDKDDIDALGVLKVDCLALGMLTALRKCLDLLAEPVRDPRDARQAALGAARIEPMPIEIASMHDESDNTPQAATTPNVGPLRMEPLETAIARYREMFAAENLFLGAELDFARPDRETLSELAELSQRTITPLVACSGAHYHVPERRYLQDVLTCIREKCTIAEAGTRLAPNGERHLRGREEIERRYAGWEDAALVRAGQDALRRTIEIAERCRFSLDELRYDYPHEIVPPGRSAMDFLEELVWRGAAQTYEAAAHKAANDDAASQPASLAQMPDAHRPARAIRSRSPAGKRRAATPARTLFASLTPAETPARLPRMPIDETVVADYDALGFSLNAHPIELIRPELDKLDLSNPNHRIGAAAAASSDRGAPDEIAARAAQPGNVAGAAARRALRIVRSGELTRLRHGQRVACAGLVTCRQRPGTAKGIVFITLEDESGMANLIVRPQVWERDRRSAGGKTALIAVGRVERQGTVIHVNVARLYDLSRLVLQLRHHSRDFH